MDGGFLASTRPALPGEHAILDHTTERQVLTPDPARSG